MDTSIDDNNFEYLIIGAGLAGSTAFYYLSQFAPTLLLERNAENFRFYSTKIICGHSEQYLDSPISREDSEIFVRALDSIAYSSRNGEAYQFGNEWFGQPYGQVVDEQLFIKWHINEGVKNGGVIKWNYDVDLDSVDISENDISINKEFSGKLLLLATGSHAPRLQKRLGFNIPDENILMIATFFADPEFINSMYKTDYFYHIHPKMTRFGPSIQLTKGKDFFNLLFVCNPEKSGESIEANKEKYLRILRNYKPIQNLFAKVKNPPSGMSVDDIRVVTTWKHPIKEIIGDRVLLLGETTGIVTPMYYEGIHTCFGTAFYASKLLKTLISNDSPFKYSKKYLQEFQSNIFHDLIGGFNKSQLGGEKLFLNHKDDQLVIWDAFIAAINKDRKIARYIWQAWIDPDMANYPLKHDDYSGERIYMSLPFIYKAKLAPFFLKIKFTS